MKRSAGIGIVIVLLALTSRGAPAVASTVTGSMRLTGHVLSVLDVATPVRNPSSAPSDPLTLTVTLNRTDQTGFAALLQDIQDPRSLNYQHFLTQQQLSDRFGPSQGAYDTVLNWLGAQGLSLVAGSANRLTLTVRGSRAQSEQAFAVTIGDYQIGNHTFYANDRDPVLPAAIGRSVQAISGLSNLALPQSYNEYIKDFKDKCMGASGFGQAGCILVIAAILDFLIKGGAGIGVLCAGAALACVAIGLGWVFVAIVVGLLMNALIQRPPSSSALHAASPTGPPQKIGLLEFDTFHPQDVADWLAMLGAPALPAGQLRQVHVNGGATGPGQGETEVLLDINTVIAAAPGVPVTVYDGSASTSFQAMFNAMLNDPAGAPTVISNSWAYCEDQTTLSDVQSLDSIFASAAASGISVFNGAGDTGSTCLDGSTNTVAVPADAPHATAVGGSAVQAGPGGIKYGSERWWDGSGHSQPTGQGGFGVSRFFARPTQQNGLTTSPMRSVPDVVAQADPAEGMPLCQADAGGCPNGLITGGTSMAAPEWAAAAAYLNVTAGHNLGNLNPLLYPLANTGAFHSASSMGSDFAHVGLGSANLDALGLALSGKTAGAVSATISTTLALPGTVPADGVAATTIQVNLRDSGGNFVRGKQVSLAASAGSHAIISAPSGASSSDDGSVTFTITDTTIENITVTATDTSDGVAAGQAKVNFVSPPATSGSITVNPTSLQADGKAQATVSVTLLNAKGLGASGKTVSLSQGSGHSDIAGPTPATTDANGQVSFKVTDVATESVTYTAVDHTDGDLAVPGTATVSFANGKPANCLSTAAPAQGYAVSVFATGFPFDPNFCEAFGPLRFDSSGNLLVGGGGRNLSVQGALYRFGPQGGVVSPATTVATYSGTVLGLGFAKDGKLYADLFTCDCNGSQIVELNPSTGAVVRTVVANQCLEGMDVDPISGDLFYAHYCNGGIYRVANPTAASPTVTQYTGFFPADGLRFGPDGTLYSAHYCGYSHRINQITATNSNNPGTLTAVADLTHCPIDLAVETDPANPSRARALYVSTAEGAITRIDLTTNPVTQTDIITGGGWGGGLAVGPDGCLYAAQTDHILKIAAADGTCNLNQPAAPKLTLTPAQVSPNPAQGTSVTLTAKLTNVAAPAGADILFTVSGANVQGGLVHADSNGIATFTYTGLFTGTDTATATATAAGQIGVSNKASVTWTPGNHTTFVNVNQSATAGARNLLVNVTGNLIDASAQPLAALAGQSLSFSLSGAGGQTCTAVTDGKGTASCLITPTAPAGGYTLTVSFAGAGQYLPSTAVTTFTLTQPVTTSLSYTGDTTLFNGGSGHVSAMLKDVSNNIIAGRTITFTLGSGQTAQSCNGLTDATGSASCTIVGLNQAVGPTTVMATFAGDAVYLTSTITAQVMIVTPDTTPPTTTASAAPPPNTAGWNTSPVTVTLSATDNGGGSGVATTYYGIDLASCSPRATASCSSYGAAFPLIADGRHTITYFSQDRAGNVEAAHTLPVNLDQVAPATTLTKASASTDCAAQVTLTATDATSGVALVEYQLDGGAWTRYSGPIVVFNNHTLTYRARDVAGNNEAMHTFSVPKSSRSRCPSPFG